MDDLTFHDSEVCGCPDCRQIRAEFDAWVEDVKRRWHNPDCGPLCDVHGDPRDTSIIPAPTHEDVRDHSAVRA